MHISWHFVFMLIHELGVSHEYYARHSYEIAGSSGNCENCQVADSNNLVSSRRATNYNEKYVNRPHNLTVELRKPSTGSHLGSELKDHRNKRENDEHYSNSTEDDNDDNDRYVRHSIQHKRRDGGGNKYFRGAWNTITDYLGYGKSSNNPAVEGNSRPESYYNDKKRRAYKEKHHHHSGRHNKTIDPSVSEVITRNPLKLHKKKNVPENAEKRSGWFRPIHFMGSLLDEYRKHWDEERNEDPGKFHRKKDKQPEHYSENKGNNNIQKNNQNNKNAKDNNNNNDNDKGNNNIKKDLTRDLFIQRHHEEAASESSKGDLKSTIRHQHHTKHTDFTFSTRDKDARPAADEIMRTMNFPKKIYPTDDGTTTQHASASGDDPTDFNFENKDGIDHKTEIEDRKHAKSANTHTCSTCKDTLEGHKNKPDAHKYVMHQYTAEKENSDLSNVAVGKEFSKYKKGRKGSRRHATSKRERLFNYMGAEDDDMDALSSNIRRHNNDIDNDDEGIADDEDDGKDDMERSIERKEKEIQHDRLRHYKGGTRNDLDEFGGDAAAKSEENEEDFPQNIEDRENRNRRKHLGIDVPHERQRQYKSSGRNDLDEDTAATDRKPEENDDDFLPNAIDDNRESRNHKRRHKKHGRNIEVHFNDDDDDDDLDGGKHHRYREGNSRLKAFHGIEAPHDGIERFGRRNEEIDINDASREGDVDQLDVQRRLDSEKNNLPEQDPEEQDKLRNLDQMFVPSTYSKERGRGEETLRHIYGMDKPHKDEGSTLRSHHHKAIEDEYGEPLHEDHQDKEKDEEDERDEDEERLDEENELKEKLYQVLKNHEREQHAREREEADDSDRLGSDEESDDLPERQKVRFNERQYGRNQYESNEDINDEDEGKKRQDLNRVSALLTKKLTSTRKTSNGNVDKVLSQYTVDHAEQLLDHLQDEALDNQRKINYQETSGRLTNKGQLSTTPEDNDSNDKLSEKRKHSKPINRKSKRHELFLAPHRRNYSKKNNDSLYRTISYLLQSENDMLTRVKQQPNNTSGKRSFDRNVFNTQNTKGNVTTPQISPLLLLEKSLASSRNKSNNTGNPTNRRHQLFLETFFSTKHINCFHSEKMECETNDESKMAKVSKM